MSRLVKDPPNNLLAGRANQDIAEEQKYSSHPKWRHYLNVRRKWTRHGSTRYPSFKEFLASIPLQEAIKKARKARTGTIKQQINNLSEQETTTLLKETSTYLSTIK